MELSKIIIGAMRFNDRASAVATIRRAVDAGFNYIDTSPAYCYKNEQENSESWVGSAINHPYYRNRLMISAKSSPGNGGRQLGEFNPAKGFGVRSEEQFTTVFDQSLKRIGVSKFDYYHLWTTHTREQLNEAFRSRGWYEAALEHRDKWNHMGITTHADSDTIIDFLETGKFETVTMPFNAFDTTRMKAVDYCRRNKIAVIAMNPLGGGLLASNERLKELSLRYLVSMDGVHPLIGFKQVEEVDYANHILSTNESFGASPEQVLQEVSGLINASEPHCTACGYCLPCPEGISVGACLSYYNLFKHMGIQRAKKEFTERQWEDGLRLDKCTKCGQCESRCPNGLPVRKIIGDAQKLLYGTKKQF